MLENIRAVPDLVEAPVAELQPELEAVLLIS